jgi:hypothetical protein
MYQCAGGGIGDGDLERMLKDEEERPSSGAITRMCLSLGIEEDYHRTINNDNAWEYFYELFSKVAIIVPKENLYDFFGSYLLPSEVDGHLVHLGQHKRKTA